MEQLGKFTLSLFMLMYSIFVNGFIALKLYNWFILELFNGPVIEYFQAIGIALLIRFLAGGILMVKEELLEDRITRYSMAVALPWMILLIAVFFK